MGKDKKKSIIVLIVAVLALALLVFVDLFGVAGKFKAKDIRLGLDLRGGASITYEVKGKVSEQDIKDTISKLSKRVESYSTEATVQKEGDKRIAVNIPGVTDETKVFKELNSSFRGKTYNEFVSAFNQFEGFSAHLSNYDNCYFWLNFMNLTVKAVYTSNRDCYIDTKEIYYTTDNGKKIVARNNWTEFYYCI